jgi:hypothetical protein
VPDQSAEGAQFSFASEYPRDWYLRLLQLCLTGLASARPVTAVRQPSGEVEFAPLPDSEIPKRIDGTEVWPADSFTMIGMRRMDNIRACIEDVLGHDVPGDLIEAGVWRGGATIFMRAVLKVHSVSDRTVYVADSFEGVPPPDPDAYPVDAGHNFNLIPFLSVPVETVQQNFETFDLLDDQVRFVKGWFRDTLPGLSDRTWSVVRVDGDLYESTINALDNLYPNLSAGGYLIVDDYGSVEPCKQAVEDYRQAHGIIDPIEMVDSECIYWQKTS